MAAVTARQDRTEDIAITWQGQQRFIWRLQRRDHTKEDELRRVPAHLSSNPNPLREERKIEDAKPYH
jgi:hypothetical protein